MRQNLQPGYSESSFENSFCIRTCLYICEQYSDTYTHTHVHTCMYVYYMCSLCVETRVMATLHAVLSGI